MMASTKKRHGILLAFATLSLAGAVQGCTNYLYSCPETGNAPVSGRTMDFIITSEMGWNIDLSPPGLSYKTNPVCADCPAVNLTLPLGFAGLTCLRATIWTDGLNTAGLSAAWLWADDTPFELPYDPTSRATLSMTWLDVVPYLMGHFSSVKEAVDFLQSDDVQVVTHHPHMHYQDVLASLGYPLGHIPLHLSLFDAAGKAALLEWDVAERKMVVQWGASVVTNEPAYPAHTQQMQHWEAAVKAAKASGGSVDPLPAPPASFPRVPGAFDPLARDIRVRELLAASCYKGAAYPRAEWAPRPGSSGISPALAAAMSILRSVELPWGATGPPGTGSFIAADTLVSILRDHASALYLFRSPGNPKWQGVRLRDVEWGEFGGKLRTIPLTVDEAEWFGDLTAGLGGAVPAGTAGSCCSGLLTTA